ncbi:Potassium/sodium hyperpolarization-activated cyclic nucleotide-gated channel 2 [Dinochytrium kinnereticum]|nr:Potassium/sodium hyperpolarization-activated cyclic nucleotide-gated channel 2 [Dinochytrium kinnereticum]
MNPNDIVSRLQRLEDVLMQQQIMLSSIKDDVKRLVKASASTVGEAAIEVERRQIKERRPPPIKSSPSLKRRHSNRDGAPDIPLDSLDTDERNTTGPDAKEEPRILSLSASLLDSASKSKPTEESSGSLSHYTTLSSEQLRLARPPAMTANLVCSDSNYIQRASVIAKAKARAAIEAAAVKAGQMAAGRLSDESGERKDEVGTITSQENAQMVEWVPVEHGPTPKYVQRYNETFLNPMIDISGEEGIGSIACKPNRILSFKSFMIHPESYFARGWNTLLKVTLIFQLLVVPFGLGFPEYAYLLQVQCALLLPVWILSTFIDSRTVVLSEKGSSLISQAHLFRRYLRSFLPLDVIFRMPYPFLIEAMTKDPDKLLYLRVLSVINICAVLRSAVFGPSWVEAADKKIRNVLHINSNVTRTAAILLGMAFYWYWSSCIKNWLRCVFKEHLEGSFTQRFTYGVYSSASEMLSSGFGSTPPSSSRDRWFTIFNMILGAVFLALLVASVTTMLSSLDSSGRMFREKLDEVQQYMLYKKLDEDLRKQIISYFEFKYSKAKLFDEAKILSELNGPLRMVPFFRDAGDAFISSVVTMLKVNHFLAGDHIISEDTSGEEMVA